MGVFNYYGLITIILILIPNIVWAINRQGDFSQKYNNKAVETVEQIGRFGCFITMIVNIPYAYNGFFFDYAEKVYVSVNIVLVSAYIFTWIIKGKHESVAFALILSILPSVLFLFDGIMLVNAPLIVFSILFAPSHVYISYKNTVIPKHKANDEARR